MMPKLPNRLLKNCDPAKARDFNGLRRRNDWARIGSAEELFRGRRVILRVWGQV